MPLSNTKTLQNSSMTARILHRQILVCPLVRSSLVTSNLQPSGQVRSDDRNVVRETRDRLEELLQSHLVSARPLLPTQSLPSCKTHPEQNEYPKQLHPKPDQRPPHKNEQHARPERQRAPPLVLAREEDESALRAQQQRDADEEQDVAHRQQRPVEEQDQAEQEEEAAAAAEGDADLCVLVSFCARRFRGRVRDGLCESESQ